MKPEMFEIRPDAEPCRAQNGDRRIWNACATCGLWYAATAWLLKQGKNVCCSRACWKRHAVATGFYKGTPQPLPIGYRVHMLVVVRNIGTTADGKSRTLVRCDCGVEKEMDRGEVVRGKIKSCGCFRRRRAGALNLQHGHTRGHNPTGEYRSWEAMLDRCTNPKTNGYENYGGRGIAICDRWRDSYEAFFADMGPKPSDKHTLDRIDVGGNYEPANCRWASPIEQSRNRRDNRWIEVDGVRRCLVEWCEVSGLPHSTITNRLSRGWSPKDAVTRPPRITRRSGQR